MNLPVSAEYLAKALEAECELGDLTLERQHAGNLILPTGQLVACDPLVNSDGPAFNQLLPRGTFPVTVSKSDDGIAFAAIKVKESAPVRWEMMTVGDQDVSKLKEGYFFGYPVDAGMGCFADKSTAEILHGQLHENDDQKLINTIIIGVHKTGWMEMSVGDANLVMFRSGEGDGYYPTYAGFDVDGELTAVVTDFDIIFLDDEEDEDYDDDE